VILERHSLLTSLHLLKLTKRQKLHSRQTIKQWLTWNRLWSPWSCWDCWHEQPPQNGQKKTLGRWWCSAGDLSSKWFVVHSRSEVQVGHSKDADQYPSMLFCQLATLEHAYAHYKGRITDDDIIRTIFTVAPEKYRIILNLMRRTKEQTWCQTNWRWRWERSGVRMEGTKVLVLMLLIKWIPKLSWMHLPSFVMCAQRNSIEQHSKNADWKFNWQFENMPRDTPQHNHMAKFGFTVISNKGRAFLSY